MSGPSIRNRVRGERTRGDTMDRFFPSSALLWTQDPITAIETIAKHGFRGVEVWAQHLHRAGTSPVAVMRRTTELGLRVTAHAVSYDLNALSQNLAIRDVTRTQVKQSLLDAAVMEAEVVVVHPGHLSSTTDDPEDYWPTLLQFCADLDQDAAVLGLTVGIEGMERKIGQFMVEPEALNRLAETMERESWDNLGITADLAHLATFTEPVPAFKLLKRVVHVHLSDGDSPAATHRPFGLGRLPIVDMINTLLDADVRRIAIEGRWRKDEVHALKRAASVLGLAK